MKTSEPLISIIVPTYNRAGFLRECINSLLLQDYKNIEIILVDSNSTDDTKEIADEFMCDSRFIYLNSPKKGACAQRSFGIKHAKGRYIQFVDSDDTVCSNFVSTMFKLVSDNQADAACCSFTNDKNVDKIIMFDDLYFKKKVLKNIRNFHIGNSCCTKIVKCEIAKKVADNFYNSENSIFLWEDCLYTYGVLFNCKNFVWSNLKLYTYNFNPNSTTKICKNRVDNLDNSIKLVSLLKKIPNLDFSEKYSYQFNIYIFFELINLFVDNAKNNILTRKSIKDTISQKGIRKNLLKITKQKEFTFSEKVLSILLKLKLYRFCLILINHLARK